GSLGVLLSLGGVAVGQVAQDEVLGDFARRIHLGSLLERFERSSLVACLGLCDTQVVVNAGVVVFLRSGGQDGNLLLGTVGQRLGSIEVLLHGQLLAVAERSHD